MNKSKRDLIQQIENALNTVNFGSVEIIVQDKKVTQISVRSIQKTSIDIPQTAEISNTGEESANSDKKLYTITAHFGRRTD